MRYASIIYLAGVVIGLLATDDRLSRRIVVALAWPLGPLAFLVIVSGLLATAVVLWPVRMLAGGAAIVGVIYALS